MANHLIIASDVHPYDGPLISAPDVYRLMMEHRCWEFPTAATYLERLRAGDRLVFYLGGNRGRYFAGEARVAGDIEEITVRSSVTFDRKHVPFFRWRLPLAEIREYPPGRAGLDDMMELSFAREKEVTRPYIGLLLRVGRRDLTDADVALLRQRVGLVNKSVR
ncbi:MAG: hypothetical protein AB1758_25455 [Candidatus Eremiobacterota bacterium]